ncbi:Protein of unknown function [Methylobacterium sp. 174MFSha1.1]|uniref:DUF3306 domain-containing protein n=1 Tax=Methylobacterium sp. 174MFSha1.1 TaxID=1502749 RepID=UPI0008F00AB6|nr:DUF3306 domain-containing protein [Methylobacterium sp. 174MFSha1.1]SFU65424.1 Protein of unknown function [Methylobacterium sp. 174MFSha1.1]
MSDGFLARWSRRKRDEARRPAEAAPEALPAEPVAAPDDEGGLSPEELAQLPSLDALTAATDLTPFLRAGVPRALRNAALRRMWSVDPAIRDFVSEAREYAYDWNTPGGVPGTGGLISAEEVQAMVERVFGGGEETSSTTSDESDVADDVALSPSPRGRGESCAPMVEGGGMSNGAGFPLPPLQGRVAYEVGRDRGSATLIETAPVIMVATSPDAASPLPARSARHPLPQRGEGETTPVLSPNSPAPAGRGDAHGQCEPPPSPPRLRRHGGAIPI